MHRDAVHLVRIGWGACGSSIRFLTPTDATVICFLGENRIGTGQRLVLSRIQIAPEVRTIGRTSLCGPMARSNVAIIGSSVQVAPVWAETADPPLRHPPSLAFEFCASFASRSTSRLPAGAADRLADHLHVERPSVHRRTGERCRIQRRIHRVSVAVAT